MVHTHAAPRLHPCEALEATRELIHGKERGKGRGGIKEGERERAREGKRERGTLSPVRQLDQTSFEGPILDNKSFRDEMKVYSSTMQLK